MVAVMASVWHGENSSHGPSHGCEVLRIDWVDENVTNCTKVVRSRLAQQVYPGRTQPGYYTATVPDVGFSCNESASFEPLNSMGESEPRLMHLSLIHI